MNTNFQRLLIAAAGLLLTGCGTVHFDAQPGQRIRLTRDDQTGVRVEHKIWYAWWGGKVLNGNHTAPFIATNQLVEVKMFTELSVGDNLINPITSIFSFSRRTLVIEGNRRKESSP